MLEDLDVVIVLERALSLGSHCGPLGSDIVCSLYNRSEQPRVLDVVAGLGGRDLSPEDIRLTGTPPNGRTVIVMSDSGLNG